MTAIHSKSIVKNFDSNSHFRFCVETSCAQCNFRFSPADALFHPFLFALRRICIALLQYSAKSFAAGVWSEDIRLLKISSLSDKKENIYGNFLIRHAKTNLC